jgi:hypothetical protein
VFRQPTNLVFIDKRIIFFLYLSLRRRAVA